MDFRIVSDSSCDISLEQEKTYGIDIIPYYVSFDGETYQKERTEISAEDFYREMAENPGVYPKTSTPTQIDFYNAFLPYGRAGEKVLYFNLTAKFSSSFQGANLAAEAIMEEYPDSKFVIIDSMSATVQQGLLVTEAAKMAQNGFSMEETIARVEELKHTSQIFFHLRRSFLSEARGTHRQGAAAGGHCLEDQAHYVYAQRGIAARRHRPQQKKIPAKGHQRCTGLLPG